MTSSILTLEQVSKHYYTAQRSLPVLQDISFSVPEGQTLSIVGPSGSGKSTLLAICAGLDAPTSGGIRLCGHALEGLSEDQRAKVRNRHVGFVFQNFQLLPTLTALENVLVPMELRGRFTDRSLAERLLERVGLLDRRHHYPAQLSGGEQQRVALARAFINTPQILFADEPTGNLDEETSHTVEQLLFELNREHGTTLVIVTHDLELAARTQRILRIRGGQVAEDVRNEAVPVRTSQPGEGT